MTGMPEAGLAREMELDYACLAIIANWAAGAGPQLDEVITLQDVLDNVEAASAHLPMLLRALLDRWSDVAR
jgi:5'-methylthioinosine phosphorylase